MKKAVAENNNNNQVAIYTDGACSGNPGPGGYGVILVSGNYRKELSENFVLTTNNRMEIFAAIAGLQALKKKCKVVIYSDSKYLVNSMELGWVKRWEVNGWKRGRAKTVPNSDLWKILLSLCKEHEVKFNWIKGHSGHPENERCDELARKAIVKAVI